MLKELKREHTITYLSLDDGSATAAEREAASEYCHELVTIPHQPREKFTAGFYVDLALNLIAREPYAVKKYESSAMRNAVKTRAAEFDVVVCDFLAPALNVPDNLDCTTILFQHNVEAMIWKRHYEVQTNPIKKAYLRGQWQKMRRFEERVCRSFDRVIAVSVEDRDQMRQDYGLESVFEVPTGVDTEFFRRCGTQQVVPHSLVFTGSMDWLPNEDAIRFFTEAIMPRIKQSLPDVTLTVVGRNPYPGLLERSKQDPAIVVTGRVDDVRPYMERAAAYVVPLRIGGGTRLKIYEAMAMEQAIVSTSIGAEGLPVTSGTELLLADSPETFADAVIRLLQDESAARDLGRRAAQTVREKFGWGQVAHKFGELCETATKTNTVRER